MPIRLPSIRPNVKPKAPPRIQPGGPRPSVPTRPTPKAPVVKPKPKPRPSAGGSGGTAAAAAAGGIVAGGAAGFLPSLIDKAGDVVNTKIIGDTIKDIGEYIVDNPWALAVIGGVVVIFIMR